MSGVGSTLARQPELAYVPTFHFDKNKPCYCHSGRLFGQCCANSAETGRAPRSIHVINDFLSPADCKRFLRFAEKQKRSWLTVVDSIKGGKRTYKRDPGRVTQHVALGKRQAMANEWIYKACREKLGLHIQQPAEWFEAPHLLRYGPDGKYTLHSDAEHFDIKHKRFYRFIDRDFSMLIYLNDDYEGGELSFPWLQYQYRPKAGDLVFFPSNHVFSHESLPIRSGTKYALVSWGALRGTPRVAAPNSQMRL